jgi:F-type H+-transporting ATPase subunit a
MTLAAGIPTLGELFNFRFGLWEIPFVNWTVLSMAIAFLLATAFLLIGTRKQAVVPGRMQTAVEGVHGFVKNNIAAEVIGHGHEKYVPYLMTLFVLIFAFNFMEVFPGIAFPATSKIAVPLFLAATAWLYFIVEGIRTSGLRYFKDVLFPPGIPWPIYILLTPIEFISNFIVRPVTLTFRLTFNLLAGHLILTLLTVLAASVAVASPKAIAVPLVIAIGVVMTGFEIFVGFLQAFIFTILTALYIGGSVHPEH